MDKIYTDGIIFDMDGTIWDNTPVFAPSWERACKDMGYDVKFTQDKLKGLFGKTMTDIADACIPDENADRRYATLKLCEEYEMKKALLIPHILDWLIRLKSLASVLSFTL